MSHHRLVETLPDADYGEHTGRRAKCDGPEPIPRHRFGNTGEQQHQDQPPHEGKGTTAVKIRAAIDHTISYNLQSHGGGGPGTEFGPTSPPASRP